jgi:hypothetical protein
MQYDNADITKSENFKEACEELSFINYIDYQYEFIDDYKKLYLLEGNEKVIDIYKLSDFRPSESITDKISSSSRPKFVAMRIGCQKFFDVMYIINRVQNTTDMEKKQKMALFIKNKREVDFMSRRNTQYTGNHDDVESIFFGHIFKEIQKFTNRDKRSCSISNRFENTLNYIETYCARCGKIQMHI